MDITRLLRGNLQWTSIPSREGRNIPCRFVSQKREIRDDTGNPLARAISIGEVRFAVHPVLHCSTRFFCTVFKLHVKDMKHGA